MIFTAPAFFFFALVSIIVLRLTRPWQIFPAIATALNLVFIWIFFGGVAVAVLLAAAALGYVLHLGAQHSGRGIAWTGAALLVLLFFTVRRYPFIPDLPFIAALPAVVGVSYLIFRMLHLIIDVADGQIARLTPLNFLAYTLFFPTLVSGPIQLYDDFETNRLEEPAQMRDVTRVALGYLKVCVLSPWLLAFQGWVLDKTEHATEKALKLSESHAAALGDCILLAGTIIAGMIWFIYLYQNFSGYMDIVIGWGRLAGVRLPENFNRPFTANSYLDYWNRWHMTLSRWFRAYLFAPLYKIMLTKFRAPEMLLRSSSLFVTFVLIGVWHGRSWPYLVYGAVLGVAAAVNNLYRDLATSWLGRPRMRRLNSNRYYQWVCFGLTFTLLSGAITPLWMTEDQFATYLAAFLSPGVLVLPCLWLGSAMVVALIRLTESAVATPLVEACKRLGNRIGQELAQALLVAAQVNVILLVSFADYRHLPSFVYQGF